MEPRAVSPPRAIGTPSRHYLKCGRMDIVFIDSTSWAAYDPDTPFERPLGGTQSAVCYLAPELAKLGHRVTLASRAAEPKLVRGVRCQPSAARRTASSGTPIAWCS